MGGTYTGADLRRTPTRPGAQDAARLPSLVGGRKVLPEQMHAQFLAPAPATPAPPAAAPRQVYITAPPAPAVALQRPRPAAIEHKRAPAPGAGRPYQPRFGGSVAQVLQYLRQHGGHILRREVTQRYGLSRNSISATFDAALNAGVLIRVNVDGNKAAFALPGYTPPARPVGSAPPDYALTANPTPEHLRRLAATLVDTAQTMQLLAAQLQRAMEAATTHPQLKEASNATD